jgi:hypothetical protein
MHYEETHPRQRVAGILVLVRHVDVELDDFLQRLDTTLR